MSDPDQPPPSANIKNEAANQGAQGVFYAPVYIGTDSSVAPLSRRDREKRRSLLRRVRQTWIEGALEHSLLQTPLITLDLQDQPDAFDNPWEQDVQETNVPPRLLPSGTTIIQMYDKYKGELLILGKPGSGKTTYLLELTHTLLERAEKNESMPIPVVFHLSSWARKQEPLATWLIEELREKYLVPHKLAEHWIRADNVVPLLDGLDEIATNDARCACIEKINDYCQQRENSSIVVCCRSQEYSMLFKHSKGSQGQKHPIRIKLELLGAVNIRDLTDEQINSYLEQIGEQVRGLKDAIKKDTELCSLARQPLMLKVMTLTYQGTPAKEIITRKKPEKLRYTIISRYVDIVLNNHRKKLVHWKQEQMRGGLTLLAKQMKQRKQTIFLIEDLQPDWLVEPWRMDYHQKASLIIGSPFGLLFGAIFGLFSGVALGWTAGLLCALIGGLVCWFFSGIAFGRNASIQPAEALCWSWEKARSGLLIGLGSGVLAGLLLAPISGLLSLLLPDSSMKLSLQMIFFGLTGRLFITVSLGLAMALFFGLFAGTSDRQLPVRPPNVNEGIRLSYKNGLIAWLAFGLLFGICCGLLFGWFYGFLFGMLEPIVEIMVDLFAGLLFGLFFGLQFGWFYGLGAFVEHFLLRFYLWRRGDIPWHLESFLEEARERSLLLRAGGGYMFVHRTFLDYFTDPNVAPSPISSEPLFPATPAFGRFVAPGIQKEQPAPPGFKLLHTLTGDLGRMLHVAWSPDGHKLACSDDNIIHLWDTQTGQKLPTLTGHSGWIKSLAWSPDGQMLASGSYDKTICLWNARTGQILRTLTGHAGWIYSVAWSPDGRMLVSSSFDRSIRLWNARTGQELRVLKGHLYGIPSVAWSPDGQKLLSGSADKTIRLWNVRTGQELRTLRGHTKAVLSVAWSPDGQKLLSGSADKTIRLWNAQTGKLISTLEGHTGRIHGLSFSSDGRLLASKSRDGTVRVWNTTTWQSVVIAETASFLNLPNLAFHPIMPILATIGQKERVIDIWNLDVDTILKATSPGTV